MKNVQIDNIKVERLIDEYPDISYLETKQDEQGNIISSCKYTQEEYLRNPEQVQGYIDEDNRRLEQFHNNEICMIGIQAKTEVSYSLNKQGDRRIERFTSSGLWGIESDSEESYLEEIQKEQIEDLKEHLRRFNVDLGNFEELTQQALQEVEKV